MKEIKVKTPAKINLTLEIVGKRADGFHNIQSIMQTISLYDYLTIKVEENNSDFNTIELYGSSDLIPYDNKNIVYKALDKYLTGAALTGITVKVFIEKNIPVAAGLAGGSSNAAGALFGINKILGELLTMNELDEIASELGSDLNFCMHGGTQLATSRGEVLERVFTPDLNFVLIKPEKLSISAKEAYVGYADLENKPTLKNTEDMLKIIKLNNPKELAKLLNNHLEAAILPKYNELNVLKDFLTQHGALNTLMSGSGPTVYGLFEEMPSQKLLVEGCEVFYTRSTKSGVEEVF